MNLQELLNVKTGESFDIIDSATNKHIVTAYIGMSSGTLLNDTTSMPIDGETVCNLINGVYKISGQSLLNDSELTLLKPFIGRVKYLTRDEIEGSFVRFWKSVPMKNKTAIGTILYNGHIEDYFGELPHYLFPSISMGDMITL